MFYFFSSLNLTIKAGIHPDLPPFALEAAMVHANTHPASSPPIHPYHSHSRRESSSGLCSLPSNSNDRDPRMRDTPSNDTTANNVLFITQPLFVEILSKCVGQDGSWQALARLRYHGVVAFTFTNRPKPARVNRQTRHGHRISTPPNSLSAYERSAYSPDAMPGVWGGLNDVIRTVIHRRSHL